MGTIIVLLVLGALLLFLETILPGLVAGICGLICLLVAIVLGYQTQDLATGNIVLVVVFIGLAAGTWAWLKFFPDSRMARKFVAQNAVGDLGVEKPELLSGTGTALTQLRPSGVAQINGQRVDVVTEGGLIERGTAIKVVAIEGARIVVRSTSN